jgi:sec-independent protein translocase protein TatA
VVGAGADVDHALQHDQSGPIDGSGPGADSLFAVSSIGAPELLIVLLVVLVIFGGAKLPKLARSMGQAQSEFKRGLKDGNTPSDDEPEKA